MVIFMGLLNDLFPGVDPPRKRDMAFEDVIRATTRDMGLTSDDDFTLRVVQLSELLAIRHCVFLMGPTGSGRTEVSGAVVCRGVHWGCTSTEGLIGHLCLFVCLFVCLKECSTHVMRPPVAPNHTHTHMPPSPPALPPGVPRAG
jgi:hypothetical protein